MVLTRPVSQILYLCISFVIFYFSNSTNCHGLMCKTHRLYILVKTRQCNLGHLSPAEVSFHKKQNSCMFFIFFYLGFITYCNYLCPCFSGLIGRSWAMVFASGGFNVKIYDKQPGQAAKAITEIR